MINELCKTNNFKYRLENVPWEEKFDYLILLKKWFGDTTNMG